MEKDKRDFREFLRDEFERRKSVNPRYSQRAFAKSLNIHQGTLTHILNGHRVITPETQDKLGHALGLSPEQMATFFPHADGPERRFEQIEQDVFQMISDWHHNAILELTQIKGFQSNSKWVAKALGMLQSEVDEAVERMMRMGLMKVTKKGWEDAKGDFSAFNEIDTSSAQKKAQIQILQKAIDAVQHVDHERRSQTSMTMAIDKADIAYAKDQIKKFRRRLCEELQRDGKSLNDVYQLTISLFPLTDDLS